MDVGELLTFKVAETFFIFILNSESFNAFFNLQPVNTPKRPQDDEPGRSDDGPGEYERYRKLRRLDERPSSKRKEESFAQVCPYFDEKTRRKCIDLF